uniref:Leucine-rich repeat and coiled-coil domain-containing protein 1 n=1 Tax=Erpetoichthys calabaricus TaxID=27687 RepID=A0A8C4RS31_ERPCA
MLAESEEPHEDLCLIDKNITSLLEIPLIKNIKSLNLHCNKISSMKGLEHVYRLRHLDLSSNQITRIEGLGLLTSLRTLNLSCNQITKIEGLSGLVNLFSLNLSYNKLNDVTGLLYLHGTEQKLKYLDLHSNSISKIEHVLQCISGLKNLTHLTMQKDGKGNPVCMSPGYRELILHSVPQLLSLDCTDRSGKTVNSIDGNLIDLPGLEDYMEYLLSSDSSLITENANPGIPLNTPRIDEVLTHFRQRKNTENTKHSESSSEIELPRMADINLANELRIKKLEHQISELFQKTTSPSVNSVHPVRQKAKRDTDHTSESECESGKENSKSCTRRSKIHSFKHNTEAPRRHLSLETKGNKSDRGKDVFPDETLSESTAKSNPSDVSSLKSKMKKKQVEPKYKKSTPANKKITFTEESTYRALVEELDQEKERRWKAEKAVEKLTDQIKSLQDQVTEEKDLQSMAVHTTDRLKELLLKEKASKSHLQASVHELTEKIESLTDELKQARTAEEQQRKALKNLKDNITRTEAERLQQHTVELKVMQEKDLKAAANQRELELLRSTLHQQKAKVHQLHELLASKEQTHRKELDCRVTLTGPEFQNALAKEMAIAEKRHSQQMNELQEKIADVKQQYRHLEDEFRMALTIEATRFKEVKDSFDHISLELTECKNTLSKTQQKEKQSVNLIQELTAMVKEQKARITEMMKSKQEAVSEFKNRIRSLESSSEDNKGKHVQVELLKQEKSKLISQLTAQESVIEGLRAERRIWGQELAHQGASLAQDRGRLEARIDVLSTELETMKKQNEKDINALKIKTKIIDDQTETIRKLKEALQERDGQIRKLREEHLQTQKSLQEQLENENEHIQQLQARVERLTERKEELKQHLEDKEAEIEDLLKEKRKFQETHHELTQLEAQVRQIATKFDAKEKELLEEKEQSRQKERAAVEKLRSLDDAFRRQLESVQVAHQAELLQLAAEKQKQIEASNKKVYEVEEEMRQLLQETANSKKIMEDKMKKLTGVLKDFQQM